MAYTLPSEADHLQTLFDYAPISNWEEGYSAILQAFTELRASGMTDLLSYLKEHPEFIWECMIKIKVLDVNRKTLELFGAASREELLSNLGKIFRGEMGVHFAGELLDMWNGVLSFENILGHSRL